jgi:hypothetical protein
MMRRKILFTVGLLVIGLQSCKKAEDRSCFKSTGNEITKEITLDIFEQMELHPHIEYELIQDSLNKLVITGGQNVVNFIEATVSDKRLVVRNVNRCPFFRDPGKKIKVEIHFTSLYNLHYEGSERIFSKDTLQLPYFTLTIRDGAGPVDLKLNSEVLQADILHGWGDYTLEGEAKVAKIGAKSNGFCNTRKLLVTDSIYISSETSGDMYVQVGNLPLYGHIKSIGNVYYSGNPSPIQVVTSSSGKLISE